MTLKVFRTTTLNAIFTPLIYSFPICAHPSQSYLDYVRSVPPPPRERARPFMNSECPFLDSGILLSHSTFVPTFFTLIFFRVKITWLDSFIFHYFFVFSPSSSTSSLALLVPLFLVFLSYLLISFFFLVVDAQGGRIYCSRTKTSPLSRTRHQLLTHERKRN